MDLSKFSEYGLIGLIIGVLFFILFKMLIWVMAFIKDIIKQQNEERVNWLSTLEKHIVLIGKLSEGIDNIETRADERGKFVRTEHQEMIKTLGEINGKISK